MPTTSALSTLNDVEASLERLEQAVRSLAGRIEPILRPGGPSPSENVPVRGLVDMYSNVGQRLTAVLRNTDSVIYEIAEIERRVEL